MRAHEVHYRFTRDLRLEAINIYFFNKKFKNFDELLDFLFSFFNELKNEQLEFRTQFPRAFYYKIYVKVEVLCPRMMVPAERDNYFATTSYPIRSVDEFDLNKIEAYYEIEDQARKLEHSILVESGCEIVSVTLVHVNVTEWISRKMISERFGIPLDLIEAFETPKAIGFRRKDTKRFIFVRIKRWERRMR